MGSVRAKKMLYDERSAALDETRMRDLLIARGAVQHFMRNDLRRDRLESNVIRQGIKIRSENQSTRPWMTQKNP